MAHTYFGTLEAVECCNCHMVFGMTQELHQARHRDHKTFYCPNGHAQHFTGQSDLEKERLARQRAEQNVEYERQRADRARRDATHQERRASTFKGHCTRIRKKVKMGMCPCCQETVTFRTLRRHMQKHHPDWVPDAEPPAPMAAAEPTL